MSDQWLPLQARQFGKGARHSTPCPQEHHTVNDHPEMPSTLPTPNTTEPVVLKTLKGVKTQKGESSSHVTLSRSLQACCMAPSPVWTAGVDWQCSKLEVHGSDMGQHDPDVGHDHRTAPVSLLSLYEQIIEWDSETPLKRRSEGGVPPGPSKGLRSTCLGPSHQKLQILADWAGGLARFDRCAGIASVVPSHTFHPDFEHLIPTRQTLHRSYAVAQSRCLCAEIPRVPVGRRTIGPSALSLTFVAAERPNPRTLNWRPLLFQYLHAIRSKQHNLPESCVRE